MGEDKVVVHADPAWRNEANFIVFADLSATGLPGWEQLWARQVGEGEFMLCCIPYFVYGLALGDVFATEPSSGKAYVVSKVVRRSGRRVVRFWLERASTEGRAALLQYVGDALPLHEWRSRSLVAIDVPTGSPDAALEQIVAAGPETGIACDWGE